MYKLVRAAELKNVKVLVDACGGTLACRRDMKFLVSLVKTTRYDTWRSKFARQFSDPPLLREGDELKSFEPKYLDIASVSELMIKNYKKRAIQKIADLLEPYKKAIDRLSFEGEEELREEVGYLLSLKADVFHSLGDTNSALEALLQACHVDAKTNYFEDVSRVYTEKGQYDAAIEYANRAIELDPEKTVGLVAKIKALLEIKDYSELPELLKMAMARNPDCMEVHLLCIKYFAAIGNKENLINVCNRAIGKFGPTWELMSSKVQYLVNEKQWESAFGNILKVLKEYPAHREALREILVIGYRLEKWEELSLCLSDAQATLKIGFLDDAYCQYQLKHLQRARELLKQAKEHKESKSLQKAYLPRLTLRKLEKFMS